MKKAIVVGALAAGLATSFTVSAQAAEIKVGLLLPYSSVYASLGKEIEAGFRLALKHYAGDLGDTKIVIVKADTEVKPPVGLAKAKKLVLQDKVDVMVGVVSSGVLGAIRDFVDGSKTPLIVANAGNDKMTGAKCSPYVIRVSFSNSQISRPMGPYLAGKGVKTAYVMASDYAAGRQMIASFRKGFEASGGKIVGEAFTPFRKTKDFGPYLIAAKAAKPDAIYVFYAGGEAINYVKQYASFGLKSTVPLYGAGFLTSPLYVQVEGKAAAGVTAALHYVPTIDTPENARFQKDFQAAQGRIGSEFAVQGYDAGRMVVEAIKASGGDKAKFKAQIGKTAFTGPRGPLKIDPATNNVIQNIYIFENVMKDGKITQVIKSVSKNVQDPVNGCVM